MSKISITDSPGGKDTMLLIQRFADDGITNLGLDEYIIKANIESYPILFDDVIICLDTTFEGIREENATCRFLDYKKVQLPVISTAAQLQAALTTYGNNIPSLGMFANYGTFVNANLVDGITTFYFDWVHNLGKAGINAEVRDENGVAQILTTTEIDVNTLRINCAGAITGTWSVTGFVKI